MSERGSRAHAGEGPGWFATLGGAAILVVLGFGVGLVAGAAWQEPKLVYQTISGQATDVPLGESARVVSEPPTRTAPAPERSPLGASAGEEPSRPQREVAAPPPSAAPAPALAPARRAGYAVQVGAFGSRAGAKQLVSELRAKGFSVYVIEDTGGSARFKVRVGPVDDRAEAAALAEKLRKEHRLPTWVVARGIR